MRVVVAHSNVGVQNIAKSLFTKGIDFKLIVSQEFHFEWYQLQIGAHCIIMFGTDSNIMQRRERLYDGIEHNLIRSDDFGAAWDAKNGIGDTKIMLCTLSMLSNPAFFWNGIFKYVPVVRLIVGEASQIDTFEFKVRVSHHKVEVRACV